MKAVTKITAGEVLQELGYDKPENYIGKMRVRIGGIPVRSPYDLFNIQAATDTLQVIVGDKIHDIDTTENNEERVVTSGAKQVLKVHGEEATKRAEELQARKLAAKKTPKEVPAEE